MAVMGTPDMTTEPTKSRGHQGFGLVSRGVYLMLITKLLCGCSSMGPDLVRTGRIQIEVSKPFPGRVLYVSGRAIDDGLRVAGRVAARWSWSMQPRGHIDLDLVSKVGTVLATARAKLTPNRVTVRRGPSRYAAFRARVPLTEPIPKGAILRLTYHVGEHTREVRAP